MHEYIVYGRIDQKFVTEKKKKKKKQDKKGKRATAKTQTWEVGSKQIPTLMFFFLIIIIIQEYG